MTTINVDHLPNWRAEDHSRWDFGWTVIDEATGESIARKLTEEQARLMLFGPRALDFLSKFRANAPIRRDLDTVMRHAQIEMKHDAAAQEYSGNDIRLQKQPHQYGFGE